MLQAVRLPKASDTTAVPLFKWGEVIVWAEVLRGLIKVAFIIILAFAVYRFIKLITARLVTRQIDEEDPLARRIQEQRAHTMASLLNSVTLAIVVVVSLLTILATFINITPLLASVSIIGLAVSFGAQSLVKDMINGTFLLFEGQFGIGDVVRIGETSGLVEKITLRTTTLRDLHGVVHTIPNGSITSVSNLTKAWSRAVLDIGVAYREDIDQVIGVLRELGQEFHADPQWGELLLDPPEVLGVESFGDSAVVIRMVAKTLPLKQWDVARELRRRIKNRFDELQIEIPYPHMKFYWGEGQLPGDPATFESGARRAVD
jgi:small-conductance mechanosensitive channel